MSLLGPINSVCIVAALGCFPETNLNHATSMFGVDGIQPMTTEMAEVIRTLRRDHGVDYVRLGFYLCESDPDTGGSFGLGKALTELASVHLNGHDHAWI